MPSSSSIRTPKLQLTAKQPSTGECWIPPKKKIPHVQGQSPSKTVEGTESCLELNPTPTREARRAQTKPCVHQDPENPGFPYPPAFCSSPPWGRGGGCPFPNSLFVSTCVSSNNSFLSVSPLLSPRRDPLSYNGESSLTSLQMSIFSLYPHKAERKERRSFFLFLLRILIPS